jgi:hypothetical protein
MRTTPVACATPALASRTSLDDKTDATPAWFTQTYQYYDLPFCEPVDGKVSKREDLGEVLQGDRMSSTPYSVPFRVDRDDESLCHRTLGAKDLKRFRKSVKDDYYFQMYYDDLPIWGFIGKIEKILKPGSFFLLSVWAN